MARLAFAALCATALGHATVSAYRPGDTTCVVSESNACPLDKLQVSTTDSSALVYPGGNTRCAFDAFTDGANFSTNATYFFQVFPAPATATKKKLLLYLQGGGACTDDDSCNFALQCSQQTFTPNARALSIGVLNRSVPENVFNDWAIVHVPYCTGDVHFGNRVRTIADPFFVPLLGKDKCLTQNMTVHHNGYNNAMSAFKWAQTNYPEIDQLAIAGSSAGSLGAQYFGKLVADMWKVEEKQTKYSVIADSYAGVVPDDKPAAEFVNYMGACDLPVNIPEQVVANCKNESATLVEMITPILDVTTYADWVFINSMGDGTQRQFYELFRQGVLNYALNMNDTISVEDFYANMTELLDEYKDDSSKLTLFFVEGNQHVFFNRDNYTLVPRMKSTDTLGSVLLSVLNNVTAPGQGGVPAPSSAMRTAVASLAAIAVAAVMAL